jgi:hypothetical protein
MNNPSLIFIPDISGFTEFVTHTEIRHSKHILTELLEIIIDDNVLSMKVSEIEGDAVLFYRIGEAPSLTEIVGQVRKMFVDFHTHLKIIQRDNVCQCGACRSAINLTLKFIAHYGTVNETTIGNFSKIIGGDVILTHRLLKNKIDSREYLLITEQLWKSSKAGKDTLFELEPFTDHMEEIENFENINLKYSTLSYIRDEIPEPVYSEEQRYHSDKPDAQIEIKAPLLLVHELLTDIDVKKDFVPGIKEVRGSSEINRVNTSHTCVFDDLEIHFVTLSNKRADNELRYTEEAKLSIGSEYITDYSLKESSSGTKLEIRIFPKLKDLGNTSFYRRAISFIKEKLILIRMKKVSRENLLVFKDFCERTAIERENKA